MSNKITQAEARRLKRRINQLESIESERRRRYLRDYPGGVNIATSKYSDDKSFLPAIINNSRQLGHAVVVVADGATLHYYAIPHPEQAQ